MKDDEKKTNETSCGGKSKSRPAQENANSDKNEEKEPGKDPQPKSEGRQIVIETDGNFVRLVHADVAGNLELKAILERLLADLR